MQRPPRNYRHAFVVLFVAATFLGRIGGATGADLLGAASNRPCDGYWRSIPHPSPPDRKDLLTGVWAYSSTDIWTVGYHFTNEIAQPLVLHWDGSAWVITTTPPVGGPTYLYGVSGSSSTDVWAVGQSKGSTYVLHWNGEQWDFVPSPNPPQRPNVLYGVDVISATDAWAVGSSDASNRTLTAHWDGLRWRRVRSTNTRGVLNSLQGVAAVSSADVWAVGWRYDDRARQEMLAEHWDGFRWSISRDNDLVAPDSYFSAVAGVSSDDVWAMGDDSNERALIRHWDGAGWESVSSPELLYNPIVYGIDAIASDDVWAVGGYGLDDPYFGQPMTWHWNGTYWHAIYPADEGGWVNTLTGVSAVSPHEVWAVGYYQNEEDLIYRSQIQRFCA